MLILFYFFTYKVSLTIFLFQKQSVFVFQFILFLFFWPNIAETINNKKCIFKITKHTAATFGTWHLAIFMRMSRQSHHSCICLILHRINTKFRLSVDVDYLLVPSKKDVPRKCANFRHCVILQFNGAIDDEKINKIFINDS